MFEIYGNKVLISRDGLLPTVNLKNDKNVTLRVEISNDVSGRILKAKFEGEISETNWWTLSNIKFCILSSW